MVYREYEILSKLLVLRVHDMFVIRRLTKLQSINQLNQCIIVFFFVGISYASKEIK